jgi:TetR/AcrR family transcriptional regulator, regulator of autoinduction and epiphytic fitness
MNSATEGHRDGRTARAERTRQALVDALLALLYEGQLQPTAERISERAGVSERSLFQHFADREALYQAVAVQQFERIVPTLDPIDVSLPLSGRIEAFVAQRARLLETVTPVRRAALLLEPESEVVSGWLQSTRKQKAREVERVFRGELEKVAQPERGVLLAALVAASAWTEWEALRAHQRLSEERSRAAMRVTLTALLAAQR